MYLELYRVILETLFQSPGRGLEGLFNLNFNQRGVLVFLASGFSRAANTTAAAAVYGLMLQNEDLCKLFFNVLFWKGKTYDAKAALSLCNITCPLLSFLFLKGIQGLMVLN